MQDFCYKPGMVSVEEALTSMMLEISQSKHPLDSETVSLSGAVDRILADNIVSNVDVPPCENSAMDGYALKAIDLDDTDTLLQQGTVLAGQVFKEQLKEKHCIRIMTGAPIPEGADTVIMQEQASVSEDQISFSVTPSTGINVRKKGESIAKGSDVLLRGCRLTAADIALLASIGVSQVNVTRRLKIGLIATGDELIEPGNDLEPGQIYESNRTMVNALLQQFGADCVDFGIVSDDLASTRRAFTEANEVCDVIITSGGVSVGEADFVKDVLSELGELSLWKIAIKPGKPFAFGKLSNAWVFGLPGNPVSSYVTCQQLVLPLLMRLQDEDANEYALTNAFADTDIRKQPGRKDFQRGVYHQSEDGSYWVKPNGPQGSGIMTSFQNANCYIVLDSEQGKVQKGDALRILPFSQLRAR
ncbi:MAG: gephyrin-like molybdotransferase Glp [Pseudomonadota bacterium]